jgi:hypothetical protein
MGLSAASAEEEDVSSPATNLQLIQKMSEEIADTLGSFVPAGDSVRVFMEPRDATWFIQGVILRAIGNRGGFPTQSVSAPFEITVGLVRCQVLYSDVHRTGFLGSKVVNRRVDVVFTSSVVDKRSGAFLLDQELSRVQNDVVEMSDISRLESPSIVATHGALPKEGFFSTILEPVVTVGAIAVGVYLLFHVRSQ